jgi:hypothetical protein
VNANFERFRDELADLPESESTAVISTLGKVKQMTWDQVYRTSTKGAGKTGINYEPIEQYTADGKRIATIRVTKKFRARVTRSGEAMVFISLHPDHDSAYDEPGGEDV